MPPRIMTPPTARFTSRLQDSYDQRLKAQKPLGSREKRARGKAKTGRDQHRKQESANVQDVRVVHEGELIGKRI